MRGKETSVSMQCSLSRHLPKTCNQGMMQRIGTRGYRRGNVNSIAEIVSCVGTEIASNQSHVGSIAFGKSQCQSSSYRAATSQSPTRQWYAPTLAGTALVG